MGHPRGYLVCLLIVKHSFAERPVRGSVARFLATVTASGKYSAPARSHSAAAADRRGRRFKLQVRSLSRFHSTRVSILNLLEEAHWSDTWRASAVRGRLRARSRAVTAALALAARPESESPSARG